MEIHQKVHILLEEKKVLAFHSQAVKFLWALSKK
jgi:hypothetical protein